MNKIYYVYRHIDNINEMVFYVGKGTSGGKLGYDRKSEDTPNRRNGKWTEYVKSIGYDYTYEVVREFDNEKEAYNFEFILQKYYWSIGQCQCSLMGGEEWDRHMGVYYAKGSERNKKISEKNKGKEVSQELRDRISSKLKGVYCRESNPNKIKVVKLTLVGEFICEYESLASASRDVDGRATHISRCCKGKLGKHKGFKWMYLEDYKKNNVKK